MRRSCLLPFACVLVAASACGPGVGESDTGITPPPTQCAFGNTLYDEGEEFDSPDGCVTYRCEEGGALTMVSDDRSTVAGDLVLSTQSEVDAQACLGVVEGALTLSGGAADLSPLRSLYRVGQALSVTATEATTVELAALGEVGGSIVIADNAAMTRMAFPVGMSVFGDVTIQNNDALPSLAGAEFIGQCFSCAPPPEGSGAAGPEGPSAGLPGDGADGAGLDAEPAGDEGGMVGGGTFYGTILVADNDVLTDISAMSNLWYAWDDVLFRNNASLSSLGTLQLSEVQGDLEISRHPALPSSEIDLLVGRVDVWGMTTVCGNLDDEACP